MEEIMNINLMMKTVVILLLIVSSIYFVRNSLKDNTAKLGVVVEEHLSAFVGKKNITAILYGKNTCPYCKLAITELEKQNISYIYKNIKKSPQALQEFTELKGKAIPLLITRYIKVTGFQEQWFSRQVLVENQMPAKKMPVD